MGPLALLVIAIVFLSAFVALVPYSPAAQQGRDIFSQLADSLPGNTQTTTTSTLTQVTSVDSPACAAASADHTLAAPDIVNGSASIGYPNDYCALVAYVLGVVNQDRATNSTAPVSIDYNRAAQQHADSMLYYGYFSHFDTQGLKPYMRYSMLGGLGGDFENVAYLSYTGPHFSSTSSVEEAVKTLEESMMYNDSACCNNGHEYNILNPLHNFLSIGVAYNSTTVFFDEEFENNYVSLNFTSTSASAKPPFYVTMTGVPSQGAPTPLGIYIAYDSTPTVESRAVLDAGPHEYTPGSLIGGVLPASGFPPMCGRFDSGVTVCADSWVYSPGHMTIKFSLDQFVKSSGAGVYTIYLITGGSTTTAITTICVFVD